MTPKNPFNAQRLFDQASKEAYLRNGKKCVCEHDWTELVPTASLGLKRVQLAQHGTVHLSTCPHSEMARTCWVEERRETRRRIVAISEE